ncbi:MAG: PAS domain-containing protein [Candidatus Aminicenantales bacterium]
MNDAAKIILLVEDEAIVALDEAKQLRAEGYSVLHESSGKKAIDLVRRRPDAIGLILMDVNLGRGMDGTQAAREILKDFDIPILFLSSHTEKEIVERTEKITSYGYVVKNTGITVLSASIKMAFKLHQAHQELKVKEEALHESEENYRHIFQNMLDGYALHEIILDGRGAPVDYRFLAVNPAFERLTGLKSKALIGKTVLEVLPETERYWIDIYGNVALTGEPANFEQFHGGLGLHFEVTAIQTSPGRFAAVFADITGRKRIEAAFRENERFLDGIVDNIPDMIFVKDARSHRFIRLNKAGEELLGIRKDEILGKSDHDLFPADIADAYIEKDREAFRTRRGVDVPAETILSPSRGERMIHTRKIPILDESGNPKYLLGISEDITDRRNAEEALAEWQALMQTIIQHDPNAIAVFDENLRYIFASERYLNDYRLREHDVIGKHHYEIFPEIPERVREVHRRVLAGAVESAEEDLFERPDGSVDTVHWECRPWHRRSGAVGGMILYTEVITGRRRAEESLREMSEIFRLFMEHNPIYVFIKDANIRPVFLSKNYEKMLGRPISEMIGKSMDELFPSELSKSMIAADQRILKEGKPVDNIIEILNDRTYSTTKFPIVIDGVPRYLAGYTIDITEHDQAEEAVRRSERLLNIAQELAHVGGWEWDAATHNMSWTEEVFRIHGISPTEIASGSPALVQKSIDCYDPADRDAIREAFRRCGEEGLPYDLEFPFTAADGRRLWIRTTAKPVRDGEKIVRIVGNIMDITDRKKAEDDLRKLIRQREIIMKELQHRVKNSLAVVSGLLGLESESVTDAHTRQIFKDTRSRILSISSIYERLSVSADFDRVDLGSYIKGLAESLFKTFAPKTGNIRLKTRLDDVILDTKRGVPLGLIANELIMNSLKYAYPDGAEGEIRIDLGKSGEKIVLDVADDGVGMPGEIGSGTGGGTGLNLVRMLTEQIDGELDITKDRGTRVIVRFHP